MSKTWSYLVLIIVIIVLIGLYFKKPYKTEIIVDSKVDSLELVIDSLEQENLNLLHKIDSSQNNIKVIEHWYEKEYNIVLTQSTDSDCLFFRDYLSNDTE